MALAEAAEGHGGRRQLGEPVMLRGFLVENQACCYCTMRANENGGAPRTRTLDTCEGATVFKTASSTDRTRSYFGSWLSNVDLHHDEPLNRRPCYFDITGDLALAAGTRGVEAP